MQAEGFDTDCGVNLRSWCFATARGGLVCQFAAHPSGVASVGPFPAGICNDKVIKLADSYNTPSTCTFYNNPGPGAMKTVRVTFLIKNQISAFVVSLLLMLHCFSYNYFLCVDF